MDRLGAGDGARGWSPSSAGPWPVQMTSRGAPWPSEGASIQPVGAARRNASASSATIAAPPRRQPLSLTHAFAGLRAYARFRTLRLSQTQRPSEMFPTPSRAPEVDFPRGGEA